MKYQLATSLLATCIAATAAETASNVNAATSLENGAPSQRRVLSISDITDAKPNFNARRLLQRFKARKQRAYNPEQSVVGAPDTGILNNNLPRFLQDYEYYCPRDTCPSELCDCADEGGALEDCTSQLQSVCLAGKLGDCVYEGYVPVYQAVYCPFVSCLGEGFRENQCDCAFYDLYCSRLTGDECKSIIPTASDGVDKKPFFGCDETELASVCDQAKSCKTAGDLQGLPDLGTWVGSGMVGMKNSSEKVGSVAAGVALASTMVWGLMNA